MNMKATQYTRLMNSATAVFLVGDAQCLIHINPTVWSGVRAAPPFINITLVSRWNVLPFAFCILTILSAAKATERVRGKEKEKDRER